MKKVFEIQGGQTLTVVNDGTVVTLRIAKDGHNRGIAKIPVADAAVIAAVMTGGAGRG